MRKTETLFKLKGEAGSRTNNMNMPEKVAPAWFLQSIRANSQTVCERDRAEEKERCGCRGRDRPQRSLLSCVPMSLVPSCPMAGVC